MSAGKARRGDRRSRLGPFGVPAALAAACLVAACAVLAAVGPSGEGPRGGLGGLLAPGKALAQESPSAAAAGDRPNIVYIVTDDLDLGSTLYMLNHMPSLRWLFGEGTYFGNSFVTTSLCCPSRATVLRGQYAHNHGVVAHTAQEGGAHQGFAARGHESSTVATWLDGGGYRTGLFGKYLNGYDTLAVPRGWDDWYGQMGLATENRYNDNGRQVYNAYHDTDVLRDQALQFMDELPADSPMFLYLGINSPHAPAIARPEHEGAFSGVALPRPPSFDEADVSDKPAWVRAKGPLGQGQKENMARMHRDRLETMLAVDDAIGSIVQRLRERGELDETYVVFTSDNGYHMGQHRLPQGKMTAYEEDARVPLVVRGPGVPAGRTLDHMVLNTDIAPTFAEIGGVQAPSFVDGRSLVPLLGGAPPPVSAWRQAFVSENWQVLVPGGNGTSRPWDAPTNAALRTQNRLYVEYVNGEREFYDLREDPYQLTSRYGSTSPGLKASLASMLAAIRNCSGAGCRAAEDAPEPPYEPPQVAPRPASNNAPPVILAAVPRPTKDRTPTVRATVRDARTDLAKPNIRFYLDGRAKGSFRYDRRTNRLSYTPGGRLSYGTHRVRVEARDAEGLRSIKTWRFKVIR